MGAKCSSASGGGSGGGTSMALQLRPPPLPLLGIDTHTQRSCLQTIASSSATSVGVFVGLCVHYSHRWPSQLSISYIARATTAIRATISRSSSNSGAKHTMAFGRWKSKKIGRQTACLSCKTAERSWMLNVYRCSFIRWLLICVCSWPPLFAVVPFCCSYCCSWLAFVFMTMTTTTNTGREWRPPDRQKRAAFLEWAKASQLN